MARLLILAFFATVLPLTAHAQSWRDALEGGHYDRAAALLHPILVASMSRDAADDDPAPSKTLATMYARGLGVERDHVLACALAQQSQMATATAAGRFANDIFRYLAMEKEAERFRQELCDGLTASELRAAANSIGCYKFGLVSRVLSVGPHNLWVDRTGVARGAAGTPVGYDWECAQAVAGLRTVEVPPPADALPGVATRHFVESLTWHLGYRDDGSPVNDLRWTLLEVTADGVGIAAQTSLQAATEWSGPTRAPHSAPALSMQMIRTGHVRWRIEGRPPLRGWLLRPEIKEIRR